MVKEHPLLLLMGDINHFPALVATAELRGWTLLQARESLEILAMTVFYYPDWVIVDRRIGAEAEAVITHLASVDFAPYLVVDEATDIIAELDLRLCPLSQKYAS